MWKRLCPALVVAAFLCVTAGVVSAGDDWGFGGDDDFGGFGDDGDGAGDPLPGGADGDENTETAELPAESNLGFWEIGLSTFRAEPPFPVRSPIPGTGSDIFYVWHFSFRNYTSLHRVREHYRSELKHIGSDEYLRSRLEQTIARINQDLGDGGRTIRLRASVHTDTGETFHNISLSIIRNIAERKIGRRVETIQELRNRRVADREVVHAVAIFPEIDPEADAFEIRLYGLGRRYMPTYFPGRLLQIGGEYKARMKKCIRYFYSRPGDPTGREADPVIFERRANEWIWKWSSDVFALESKELLLERSSGLRYYYRYFPYEILNSTPDVQRLHIVEAGLAPKVRWHGIPVVVSMLEDTAEKDYWKSQALDMIRSEDPGTLPEGPRHISGPIEPGKIDSGVAVVRWGVTDIEAVAAEITNRLHSIGFSPTDEERSDPLISAYLDIRDADGAGESEIFRLPPLPAPETVREVILDQARREVAASGGSVDKQAEWRYGELAPLAVLINALAREEMEDMQSNGRIPVEFTARWNDIVESSRFVRLYAVGRREETELLPEPEDGGIGIGGPDEPTEPEDTGPVEPKGIW